MDYSDFPFVNHRLWQRALDLVVDIHELSANMPEEEQQLMAAKIRTTAETIQHHIAEALMDKVSGRVSELVAGKSYLVQLTNLLFVSYRRQLLNYFEFQQVMRALLELTALLQEEIAHQHLIGQS